jgi:hypothetical protein
LAGAIFVMVEKKRQLLSPPPVRFVWFFTAFGGICVRHAPCYESGGVLVELVGTRRQARVFGIWGGHGLPRRKDGQIICPEEEHGARARSVCPQLARS